MITYDLYLEFSSGELDETGVGKSERSMSYNISVTNVSPPGMLSSV